MENRGIDCCGVALLRRLRQLLPAAAWQRSSRCSVQEKELDSLSTPMCMVPETTGRQDGGYPTATRVDSGSDVIRVRWMACGSPVCDLVCEEGQTMVLAEVKQRVVAAIGAPAEELRFFSEKREKPQPQQQQQRLEALAWNSVVRPRGLEALLLVRGKSDPLESNLGYFRASLEALPPLPKGDFAVVQRIGTGANGNVHSYTWLQGIDTCNVAVKQLRNDYLASMEFSERDERAIHSYNSATWSERRSKKFLIEPPLEDGLTEIGVLKYLREQVDTPLYLLRLHDAFADQERQVTWVVMELAEGGDLFDVASAQIRPTVEQITRYAYQLLVALEYLHRHQIGHRDVSLENVLLHQDSVRLADFGMAVRSHSNSGTELRFFRTVGKAMYRGPECYVLRSQRASVLAPPDAKANSVVSMKLSGTVSAVRLPECVVPGRMCDATPWGYAAHPADMYSFAMCLFILCTGMPIFQEAKLADHGFAALHEKGVQKVCDNYKTAMPSPALLTIAEKLFCSDPAKRPTASELLGFPLFAELCTGGVPLHGRSPQRGDEDEPMN
eukprot:TRINITY_DN74278_c0_g1_i1.p1 TRINITY_DN74278_c0_g1~~TRINITY_DN74278_c0_g1_i1.p1  ORF type:complete len:555 (+),score=110.76 TRINITY_DN74278_c0_g1_i1:16-1680(+)